MKLNLKLNARKGISLLAGYVAGSYSFKFWYDMFVGGVYEPTFLNRLFLAPYDIFVLNAGTWSIFDKEVMLMFGIGVVVFLIVNKILLDYGFDKKIKKVI